MKKVLITLFVLISSFAFANAEYSEFINSPSWNELVNIVDEDIKYCEETFLRAYMRREFTEIENEKCRNIFARKIEAEMEYKYWVLNEREIY